MADAVTLEARGLVVEDFMTSVAFAQTTATVLGLGSGATVTPFVLAADDTAAAAASVPVGCVYLRSGGAFTYLAVRMS
jgi:ribose 5-phosphate isomerase